MGNRPGLLSSCRHQCRLAARGCHVQDELDPQASDRVDDRVDLRVVLPGLELDDAGLRDAQLLSQSPLAQLVPRAITQQRCRKLPRRGKPLPLRPELYYQQSTVAPQSIARCHDRPIEVFLLRGYRQNHEPAAETRIDRPSLTSPLFWPQLK